MKANGWDKGKLAANIVGTIGGFLIFSALVWVIWRYSQPAPLGEDRAAVRRKALAEMRAAEAEQLNNYAVLDPVKGVVRLPIVEAMKLALREWQNPAQARSNVIARVEKATAPPPKAPEKPNPYD
jgi:hypothetical protein